MSESSGPGFTSREATPNGGKSAVDYAYGAIRESILAGDLALGAPLSEYKLADHLGVSRTPVREALRRLQAVGLVRAVPGHGTFVRELYPRDVLEISEIRRPLEGLVVRSLADSEVEPALLERWEEAIEKGLHESEAGDLREALNIGRWFHEQLIAQSANERLRDILGQLSEQISLLEMVDIRSNARDNSLVSMRDHKEIIEAIRSGDPDLAESLMEEHLTRIGETLLEALLPGMTVHNR